VTKKDTNLVIKKVDLYTGLCQMWPCHHLDLYIQLAVLTKPWDTFRNIWRKDVFCTKSMTKLEAATVIEKYRNHIFLSDYRTFYIGPLTTNFR